MTLLRTDGQIAQSTPANTGPLIICPGVSRARQGLLPCWSSVLLKMKARPTQIADRLDAEGLLKLHTVDYSQLANERQPRRAGIESKQNGQNIAAALLARSDRRTVFATRTNLRASLGRPAVVSNTYSRVTTVY